jgi:hypothetical protein
MTAPLVAVLVPRTRLGLALTVQVRDSAGRRVASAVTSVRLR